MSRLQDLKAAMKSSDVKSIKRTPEEIRQSVYDKIEEPKQKASVSSAAPAPVQETARTPVNSLLDYYIRIAGSFAHLSGDLLTQNLIVVADGLPEDVRIISLESLMYIASNFGEIIAAMVLNYKDVRKLLADTLAKELDLMKDYDARTAFHEAAGSGFDMEAHSIELGVTQYAPDTELIIAEAMRDSIGKISDTKLSGLVDSALAAYTQQDADDMGAILSNPVYLLIAFNYNAAFFEELTNICDAMMDDYR